MEVVCGIDLAGSPNRVTGVAAIAAANGGARLFYVYKAYSDSDIIDSIASLGVTIAAIDSPLSLPRPGRWYRDVDIAMKRMGYRVLPPRWRGMELLTRRAIAISSRLRLLGVEVIETHPRSALLSSRCRSWREATRQMGVGIEALMKPLTRDEEDAIVSALVAYAYKAGVALAVRAGDGVIYLLPRLC